MKTERAMKIIADQMDWDHATAAKEFQELGLMVDYKYDHYQGFLPGSRFYLALVGWLNQFDGQVHRKVAYQFLKQKLIFFSQREIHHLVGLLMPIVDRALRKEVAEELSIPLYQTWLDNAAIRRVKLKLTRTLFIGLSDGARIDVFRRFNEGRVSNEQVVASSEISEDKWIDLVKNLKEAVVKDGYSEEEAYFERFCLIDDFTGSGSSLIDYSEEEKKWRGKIKRFSALYSILMKSKAVPKNPNEKIPVQVHHHLASAGACANIQSLLAAFEEYSSSKFKFMPTYSYKLPAGIVIGDESATELIDILLHYYDKKIEDKHTKADIWFGYRQSGLPLILEHNTPNNSIALLWAESTQPDEAEKHPMKPLFIRRKRHSSHG